MSTAPTFGSGVPAATPAPQAGALSDVARLWWIWLLAGIAWCFAALVILQFDQASVTTVGIIVGLMFLVAGCQQLLAGMVAERGVRWILWVFGVLFLIAGVLALIRPVNTFAGLADMLGFLFLLVGIWWTMEPLLLRQTGNPLWWFGFVSGPLMIIAAFWTSGQFFIEKAYVLLVFAGIWALMHGIGDIIKAFAVRSLRDTAV
jgi:uncharacterized membrane protein HdeD (DUF308 family)